MGPYEWTNFRLCCGTFNSTKNDKDCLDPTLINNDWFQLDLIANKGAIRLNTAVIPNELLELATQTCKMLNNTKLVKERADYINAAIVERSILASFLLKHAPFVHAEIVRQLGTNAILQQ